MLSTGALVAIAILLALYFIQQAYLRYIARERWNKVDSIISDIEQNS